MTKGFGRGFASMDPEKRRQLAQRGGRRAHEVGRAHIFSSEEAVAAGKKGGSITGRQRHEVAVARERITPVDDKVRARIYDQRLALETGPRCSKCDMPGPEHRMCAGRPPKPKQETT